MLLTSIYAPKNLHHSLLLGTSLGLMALMFSQTAAAITNKNVTYMVDNQPYEEYYAKADKANAPFILLIHDWEGLTDYERKRADMLASEGFTNSYLKYNQLYLFLFIINRLYCKIELGIWGSLLVLERRLSILGLPNQH